MNKRPAARRVFAQKALTQLLFIVALMGFFGLAHAAESPATKTNNISLGSQGTLQIPIPADWTIVRTNLNLQDKPVTIELHSVSNSIVVRLYIRWDGFRGTPYKPTEADMSKIVSNNVVIQYLPIAVEKTFELEKLHGPGVTGTFARITDSKWTPMVKGDSYPNLVEGMFRCDNIWGNFNIVSFGKDTPLVRQALNALESMRRTP